MAYTLNTQAYQALGKNATTTTGQRGDLYLMPLVVHHSTVKANNNSLGNRCHKFADVSVILARTCSNVCEHVAIITETKSTYVMIEFTLQFDDVEVIPGLLPLLWAVQRSRMQSREWSGRWPGNEATPHLL